MDARKKKSTFLTVLILVFAGLAVYSNTMDVPFYFDDHLNIQDQSLQIESFTLVAFVQAGINGLLGTRPVSNMSFAVNYYFNGYDVLGYHILNLIIHISAAVFLFLLLRATLRLPVNRNKYPRGYEIAGFAAMLWMVHPLATQSVTYIVQRMNSMAAMFFVLSILLYVMGRSRQVGDDKTRTYLPVWVLFLGSVFSGLLALGSKENSAILPFIIFFYEWYFFQNLSWEWIKKRCGWLVAAIIAFGFVVFLYIGKNPWQVFFSDCPSREFTSYERLLTQFRVVFHYIGLLLYPNPNRLVFDYNFPLSTSFVNPINTLYSFAGIVALLVLAGMLARRERLLSFCLFWFFGTLVIESSVICLEIIFEHRTYLPSMFMVLFLVALFFRSGMNRKAMITALTIVVLLFGYWSYDRNELWGDPVSFWSDSVDKYPGKARSHNNLGLALYYQGDTEQAKMQFATALNLKPDFPEAHTNLSLMLNDAGDKNGAESHLKEALRLKPDYLLAHIKLANLYYQQGRIDEAIRQFTKVLLLDENDPDGNRGLGHIYLHMGQIDKGTRYLNRAVQEENKRFKNYSGF